MIDVLSRVVDYTQRCIAFISLFFFRFDLYMNAKVGGAFAYDIVFFQGLPEVGLQHSDGIPINF